MTLKSLKAVLKKSSGCHFIVWIHKSQVKTVKKFLNGSVKLIARSQFISLDQLTDLQMTKFNFLIHEEPTPAHWFKHAAQICKKNGDAIITGPLSKTQIVAEGIEAIGHTEILKAVTKVSDLNMAFMGRYFSMILFTGHIPVNKITYSRPKFKMFFAKALDFHKSYKHPKAELAVLGLNPHAGDDGLIGSEDAMILKDVRALHPTKGLKPADSAFVDFKRFKYNPTFISLYHDQGLIPFKMAHGFTGFHFTLGLPFVRTSVDHGTAKDIFNKNCADPSSMTDAILGAIKLQKGVS